MLAGNMEPPPPAPQAVPPVGERSSSSTSSLPKKRWRCDVCKIRTFENYDDACRHEEQCRAADNESNIPIEIVDDEEEEPFDAPKKEVHAFFRPNRPKRPKQQQQKQATSMPVKQPPTKKKTTSITAAATTISKENRCELMNVSDPKVIDEQQRAWKLWKSSSSKSSSSSAPHNKKQPKEQQVHSQKPARKNHHHPSNFDPHAAPRFPKYSHVIGCTNQDEKLEDAQYEKKKLSNIIHTTAPGVVVIDEDNVVPQIATQLLEKTSSCANEQNHFFSLDCTESDNVDIFIHQSLSALLLPPPPTTSRTSACARLWVDKYCLGDPPIGSNMQNEVQHQIREFIQRYQIQRSKAMTRMAERQRRMKESTKKSRPSQRKRRHNDNDDDDDDWLWGSDCDSDGEDDRLCLITGPVGCGKSAAVHAVAKSLHCRILEIHTGQKRGATAMKRCIEEATQSHSLSMDKQKQQPSQKKNKQPTFFRKQTRVVVDTDSEEEEEEEQPSSDPRNQEEAAAITVILIDEVDNLYEENGDSGFWTALNELYKKSKCPILLTANTVPSKLEANSTASTFRFVHVQAQHPTPTECAERLMHIITAEGFRFQDNDDGDHNNDHIQQLEKIATLANGDLRRLVNQLQIMSLPVQSPKQPGLSHKLETRGTDLVSSSEWADLPRIDSIQPHAIPVGEYSVFTIHGSTFLALASDSFQTDVGYPCEVYVGDHLCPKAVILDDSTILAVAAPWSVPDYVDSITGKYKESRKKSWMAEYAALTVVSTQKRGILSSTQRALITVEAPDGTRVSTLATPCNMEIHYPGHVSMVRMDCNNEDPNESSENEFEPSNVLPQTTSLALAVNSVSQDIPFSNHSGDAELVSKLFQNEMKNWCSKHNIETITEPTILVTADSPMVKTMESIALDCKLLSDAALLEDIATFGTPYLSGSCRGYGYELTEEYPKYTNESTKPPPEDRLFELGWKDDNFFYGSCEAYVPSKLNRRERDLLIRTEHSLRGMSSCRTTENTVEDEERENEMPGELPVDKNDEDMFLPHLAPFSLRGLPAHLRRECRNPLPVQDPVDHNLFEKKKSAHSKSMLDIMCEFIFSGPLQTRSLYKTVSRLVDPLVRTSETLDRSIFLDYLPLLRCMAVHEHIANILHQISMKENPDAAHATTNRKRSTRRGKKLGREHYLEVIAPAYTFQKSEQTAKEIGDRLCQSALICERYVSTTLATQER